MEDWKQGTHEHHSWHYATVQCVWSVGTKVREYPIFSGNNFVLSFIKEVDYYKEES